jgi:fibronectin type 3 domain-containing protein
VGATDYTDSTVASGTTYYYVVTAVDSNNNESAYSNQATAVIP